MFAQPCRGRAWSVCPQPRRRSWLRKQSVRGPRTPITTGRRRGPFAFGYLIAYGETPELRFWARETRAGLARRTNQFLRFLLRSTSTAAGWDGRRSPASNYSVLPHCDLGELVCWPSAAP